MTISSRRSRRMNERVIKRRLIDYNIKELLFEYKNGELSRLQQLLFETYLKELMERDEIPREYLLEVVAIIGK